MAVLKPTHDVPSELVAIPVIPANVDPIIFFHANERQALAFTESGWLETVTADGIVQRDLVKKDCGCGKKARA